MNSKILSNKYNKYTRKQVLKPHKHKKAQLITNKKEKLMKSTN